MRAGIAAGCVLTGAVIALSSCATTAPPKQFRTFFAPPARAEATQGGRVLIEPPNVTLAYANEAPLVTSSSLPSFSRPSDVDFLIKKADDRFASGKRAFQEGRTADSRADFDRVLDVLVTAPENLPDRARLERHIDELIERIYRYDVDQAASSEADEEVRFEKSPIDEILQMTFPIDPSLRHKVQEQIRVTASQLPLEQNDAVVSYINYFSSPRGKKILAYGLRRSGRYKPMIENILHEEGVPQELIFLAQAESGFTPRAMSRARCVGVWQFAAFRGKEYGLNQTPATDDRMDPELATRAAARHLHDLYNHFGDWNLAMAAYNCGPGCVDQAIQRTGYADFWQLRRMNVLPRETANYVPAILAMTIIGKNAKDYGLDDLDLERPLEYDTIELVSPTHLSLIADAIDRPLTELKELNPAVLRSVAPAGTALHVPKGTMQQVEAAFRAVPANRRDTWRVHKLESEDTFAGLAKRYGTTAALLSSANHDELPEPGSLVVIPAAYPGDRIPVRTAVRATGHVAARSSAKKPVLAASRNKPKTRAAAPAAKTPTKASAAKGATGRAG
ncbi:MAG TPA: transglycosylase SLT domain-containing protein [Bryobacteraceae bacterium]|nr:transglycosylase SLT domain-containing protein [Bryobacteraceae bacterium]